MELTPEQIAAIVGTTLGVALATTSSYLSGRAEGMRLGQQRGHREGYSTALAQAGAQVRFRWAVESLFLNPIHPRGMLCFFRADDDHERTSR